MRDARPYRRRDLPFGILLSAETDSSVGGTVLAVLVREGSEAEAWRYAVSNESCRMHDPLQFAVTGGVGLGLSVAKVP